MRTQDDHVQDVISRLEADNERLRGLLVNSELTVTEVIADNKRLRKEFESYVIAYDQQTWARDEAESELAVALDLVRHIAGLDTGNYFDRTALCNAVCDLQLQARELLDALDHVK